MKTLIIISIVLCASSAQATVRCHEFMGGITCNGFGDDAGYHSRTTEFMGSTTTREYYNGDSYNQNNGFNQNYGQEDGQ